MTSSHSKIAGNVDGLLDGRVSGWLLRRDEGPRQVDLYVGEEFIASTPLRFARPDVNATEPCGFRFSFPRSAWAQLEAGARLSVKAAASDFELKGKQTVELEDCSGLLGGWPNDVWELDNDVRIWNLRDLSWRGDADGSLLVEAHLHHRGIGPGPVLADGVVADLVDDIEMAVPAAWTSIGIGWRRITLRMPAHLVAVAHPVRLSPAACPEEPGMAAWMPPLAARSAAMLGREDIRRVIGEDGTPQTYISGGWSLACLCAEFLKSTPLTGGEAPPRLLDWGCGSGRVLDPLRQVLPGWQLVGAELDPVTRKAATTRLGDVPIVTAPVFPPLAFPTDHFDAIIGISVFSHFAEPMQRFWLPELHRALKPGGKAILTTHNMLLSLCLPKLFGTRDWIVRELKRYGISDCLRDGNLGPDLPLGTLYRSVFQSEAQIRASWGEAFQIERVARGAMELKQDVWVLSK